MSDGYVQVLFDPLTLKGEVTIGSPQPQQWRIVHDAAGKIVVRDSEGLVIATARWIEQRATNRAVRTADVPSHAQWDAIEHAIGAAVREARNAGAPDERTDDGFVPKPVKSKKREKRTGSAAATTTPVKDDPPLTVAGWIGAGFLIALAGFAIFAVLFWVVPWLKKHDLMPEGSTANGEACTADFECKSGDCYKKTCRGEAVKVRGDRCDRDADCKRGTCSSGMCN